MVISAIENYNEMYCFEIDLLNSYRHIYKPDTAPMCLFMIFVCVCDCGCVGAGVAVRLHLRLRLYFSVIFKFYSEQADQRSDVLTISTNYLLVIGQPLIFGQQYYQECDLGPSKNQNSFFPPQLTNGYSIISGLLGAVASLVIHPNYAYVYLSF